MKPVRLASIALQAERVRFSHVIRRLVLQAALICVALGIVLIGVVFGEYALYHLLLSRLPPAGAAGVLAGADLVIGLIVVWIATAQRPGTAEREARELSISAREGIRQSLNWTQYLNWKTMFWIFELVKSRRRKRN